jgi:hypothetical protein
MVMNEDDQDIRFRAEKGSLDTLEMEMEFCSPHDELERQSWMRGRP